MYLVPFNISFALTSYMSICNHITYIVHNLCALDVAQRIQVIGTWKLGCIRNCIEDTSYKFLTR